MRPGNPAPPTGPGTGVKVKLSNVNELPVSVKTALVMSKLERLRKIFGGRPVPAPISPLFPPKWCRSALHCCNAVATSGPNRMADRAENNKVPTRNAPNSYQEPERCRGPDDRPTPPPHHRPLPSRIASQRRNHRPKKLATDFCNKICPQPAPKSVSDDLSSRGDLFTSPPPRPLPAPLSA